MERRYELRLERMLAQAEVSPKLMRGLLKWLDAFAGPFATSLAEPEQQRHAVEYMTGLLSKLERKTGEAIDTKACRSSLGMCLGTTSDCSRLRSARTLVRPLP